jgi:imidazolonepropionase-like amidohydrolase
MHDDPAGPRPEPRRPDGDPAPVVLDGVRTVDARGVSGPCSVAIVDGRIVTADVERSVHEGRSVARHDARGRYLVPGLFNLHTHMVYDGGPDPHARYLTEDVPTSTVMTLERLRSALGAGVTTIRDVGCGNGVDLAISRMQADGEVVAPRILAAGRVITMTGGHGHQFGREADGPDDCRRAAREQLKAGATTLKTMATGGMMTPGRMQRTGATQLSVEEMRAVCEVGHAAGAVVAAHVLNAQGALNAIRAGIDSIEHGHWMDAPVIEEMLANGTSYVPTILSDVRIVEHGTEAGIPDFVVEKCRRSYEGVGIALSTAISMGARILCGNDAGAPMVAMGEVVDELLLYEDHGMSRAAALATATSEPARFLGLTEVGLVEHGWVADLLLLESDPLEDLRALRTPIAVLQGGVLRNGDLGPVIDEVTTPA